jgi:hypothetical protein
MPPSQVLSAVAPPAEQHDSRRIDALDFTKGALVCFMAVYHSLNYSAYSTMAYQYFAFVPPSFIFITGFLLTHLYLPKYKSLGSKVQKRLIARGAKLIFLFLLLNAGISLVSRGHAASDHGGLTSYWRAWQVILIGGNGQLAGFQVLLPIGYLLIFSPLLLFFASITSWSIPAIAASLSLLCVFMELKGVDSYNLQLLSAGIIGMSAGLVSLDRVNAITRRWLVLVVVYAIYWFSSRFFMYTYVMQIVAVCLSLLVIYAAGQFAGASGIWQKEIILLGKYSLVGYISQIVVLQVCTRLITNAGADWVHVIGQFLLTLLLMSVIVHTIDWLRGKRQLADRAYKLVFA